MPHQQLYNKLFQKTPGEPGNTATLEAEARQFPYFGPLHFFLLKEAGAGHKDYASLAGKAAIHFNNPYLLHIQLNKKIERIDIEKEIVAESIENITLEENSLLSYSEAVETTLAAPKDELLFEPLYTTDYFASQGIKLSEEMQGTDKLGKQLKSFTEWLKTMKKVHGNKLPENSDPVDSTVQKLAENSNREEDVITEAMAEVYEQQGKSRKAIDIYQKLSLLNPAKSAYFAAKIDLLNNK